MGKINYTCEFGVVHKTATCRCTSNHVETRPFKCLVPEEHGAVKEDVSLTVKHLRARLEDRLRKNLGDIILPLVIDDLAYALEKDVRDWLREKE